MTERTLHNDIPINQARNATRTEVTGLLPVAPEILLASAKTLAQIIGLSLRTIRRMDAAGEIPRPIRRGRVVRWRLAEIRSWVEAGCPDRMTWEHMEDSKQCRGVNA